MSIFVKSYMQKTVVSEAFLAEFPFTYDQLYAIVNYRKNEL